MSPDPAMAAARARLRAYLAAGPPATRALWEWQSLTPSAYGGERERPDPGPAEPPPPAGLELPADLVAAVDRLDDATAAAERVGAAARRASGENWELARTIVALEQRLAAVEHELAEARGGPDGRSPAAGRPAGAAERPAGGPGGARAALEGG